jgi:hypothetical protein
MGLRPEYGAPGDPTFGNSPNPSPSPRSLGTDSRQEGAVALCRGRPSKSGTHRIPANGTPGYRGVVPLESAARPRVTRETRRLLSAAILALISLWVLARLRFPEAPVAANPVPPLLAQLSPPAGFAQLSEELASAAAAIRPTLTVVSFDAGDGLAPRLALQVGPGIAAVVSRIDRPTLSIRAATLATDRPQGLMLVATQHTGDTALPPSWSQTKLNSPPVLFAAVPTTAGAVSVTPVVLGTLTPRPSTAWRGETWLLSPGVSLPPGAFLFTTDGSLVGVIVDEDGERALVPANSLYDAINTLRSAQEPAARGWLGVRVAALTPRLVRATRVNAGVVVTTVDSRSPSAGVLSPGEVITAINELPIGSPADWRAAIGRLDTGAVVETRIQYQGDERVVRLTASAQPEDDPSLGARFRRLRQGAEVLSVAADSAASAAGILPGDVITLAGRRQRPTPAQIERAFAAPDNDALLVLVARGPVTFATALER